MTNALARNVGIRVSTSFGRCLLVILQVLAPAVALAQAGDGAYGRWEHGLVVQAATGISLGRIDQVGDPGTTSAAPAAAFDGALRARILDAAGPSLGIIAGGDGVLVLAGIELRPLWPALFLLDMSTGRRWVDRFIQSIGVELSAVFTPSTERRGVALATAFHIEAPLIFGRPGVFDGVRLRVAARRIRGAGFVSGPSLRPSWTGVISIAVDLGASFSSGHAEPSRYRPR